jgi:hypothetical protein
VVLVVDAQGTRTGTTLVTGAVDVDTDGDRISGCSRSSVFGRTV